MGSYRASWRSYVQHLQSVLLPTTCQCRALLQVLALPPAAWQRLSYTATPHAMAPGLFATWEPRIADEIGGRAFPRALNPMPSLMAGSFRLAGPPVASPAAWPAKPSPTPASSHLLMSSCIRAGLRVPKWVSSWTGPRPAAFWAFSTSTTTLTAACRTCRLGVWLAIQVSRAPM